MSAASFSNLTSQREAMSWDDIDPTKCLGRRRGRLCFGICRNVELPNISSAKGGSAWRRKERDLSPPKSAPSMGGAWFARRL